MKDWPERGRDGYHKSYRYIRAYPEKTLTNGFFVASFKRRKSKHGKSEENGVECGTSKDGMKDGQESYSDKEEDRVERKKEKQMKRLGKDSNTKEEGQVEGEIKVEGKERAKKRKKDQFMEEEGESETGVKIKRKETVGSEENRFYTQVVKSNQTPISNCNLDCGNNSIDGKSRKKHKKKRPGKAE